MQVKTRPILDATLSDICIATSAAPTYFPAHYFANKDEQGNVQDFNLVDGGVAANNPVRYFFDQIQPEGLSESELLTIKFTSETNGN